MYGVKYQNSEAQTNKFLVKESFAASKLMYSRTTLERGEYLKQNGEQGNKGTGNKNWEYLGNSCVF